VLRAVQEVVAAKATDRSANKFNEFLGLISFAFTVASWGWTVVAPDSSIWFGSCLLFVGVLATLAAIFRIWPTGKLLRLIMVLVTLSCFVAFDWFVVIKPQRGKPFKELLVEGYHISSECSGIPAHSEMPEWMRNQSLDWQTRATDLVGQKLGYKDIQLWRGAVVVGLAKDTNMTAYQCTSLAVKISALETLIAAHYDSKLRHQDYNGPVYWMKSVDGKVDISEAFKKNGNGQAAVYIDSDDSSKPPDQK